MLHGLKQLCRQDAASRSFAFPAAAGGCAGPTSIGRVCISLSSPSSSSSDPAPTFFGAPLRMFKRKTFNICLSKLSERCKVGAGQRAVQDSFPSVSSVCEAHASGRAGLCRVEALGRWRSSVFELFPSDNRSRIAGGAALSRSYPKNFHPDSIAPPQALPYHGTGARSHAIRVMSFFGQGLRQTDTKPNLEP